MKKIIILIVFVMAIVGCSARDIALWKEVDRENAERDVRCYRKANGNAYCEDKYGNRVY